MSVSSRHLAASCKFGNLESAFIRDRVVLGVSDISLRKKLLNDASLTLTTAIDTCRAHEATDNVMRQMGSGNRTEHEEGANLLLADSYTNKQSRYKHKYNNQLSNKNCIYCGGSHMFKKNYVPSLRKNLC